MAELQLQPSISTDKRSQALLQLIERLQDPSIDATPGAPSEGKLDLSPILVYRMASLVDSAVIPMAWQFDCLNPLLIPVATQLATLSFASFDQITAFDTLTNVDLMQFLSSAPATNPTPTLYAQYRALILLSTKLHSIMGTPAALQEAFAGLGFPNATILEGQNSWGGNQYPPSQGWAVFRIQIPLASVPAGTNLATFVKQAIAIANFWKPARCLLDAIAFQTVTSDTLIPPITDTLASAFTQADLLSPAVADFIVAMFAPIAETKIITPFWNNEYFHTSVTYGANEPSVGEGPLVANGNAIVH